MANGVELGTAYLSLIASTNKLAPSVRKAMGGVEKEASKAGDKSGQSWASKWTKRAAIGLGGAAVAGVGLVAGAAITKGFNRAIQLQDAEAKLKGLGNNGAATAKIMDNALAAVKGTAFGMGDAATVAASMVAAGVKPGKDLEKTLTLVGDAATIAGVDMGSMGAIFGKVAASNKVQMDSINQLHDAGVPALQLLAEEMGVSAEEASKMASAGKIDFATFKRAMDEGLGGAAQKSGETFRGSLANMGAALGRLGVAFAGPIVTGAPKLFTAITGAIDSLGESEAFQTFSKKFSDWLLPALNRTSEFISKIDFGKLFDSMKGGLGPLAQMATALSPLGIILRGMKPVLPQIGASLAAIGAAVGGVLAKVLPVIAEAFLEVGEALAGAVSKVLPSLIPLFNALATAITAAGPALAVLVPLLADMVVSAINLVTPILQSEKAVVALVAAFVAWKAIGAAVAMARFAKNVVWSNTVTKTQTVLTKAQTIATKAAAVGQRILNLAMKANPIGIIITLIAGLVAGLVWFFTKTKVGKKIITVAWAGIKAAIKGVADWWTKTAWPAIKKVITAFGKAFQKAREIIGKVWDKISDAIGTAWDWIKKNVFSKITLGLKVLRAGFVFYRDKVRAIWGKVKEILKAGWDWVRKNVFDKIKLGLTNLRDRFAWIRDKAKAIWNRLGDLLKAGWNWIRDNVFARIKAGISGVRDRFALIRDRIGGIWTNLRDKLRDGWNWIRDNVFSKIKAGVNAVKDAFGKARDGIRTIWNKLKAIAAKPINFLINTVYMGGIRKLVGKVFDWLGKSNPLPEIKPVSFATGGYTGPGGKYQPAGIVHADEYVVRKESRAKFERKNPGALDYLNRTGELPGFARGGRVGAAAKWWQDLGARVSEFGGWGQSVAPVHMKNSRHYAGKAADLNYGVTGPMEQGFFDKHVGAFRQAFPDINVLWRVPNHFNHMHIDDGAHGVRGGSVGGGGGFDFFGIIRKLGDLKKKFSGALFDSPLGGMVKDVGGEVINGPIQWIKDRFTGAVKSAGSWIKRTAASAGVNLAAGRFGWDSGAQWDALSWIINKESGWNPHAANPSSSARGLFQKMTSVHGPIEKSVMGQADWGLNYIKSRYGNPLAAKAFHESHGYYADGGRVVPKLYDQGGWLPKGLSVVENKTGRPEPVLNPEQWASMSNAGPGVHVEQLVVADPDDAVRKLERMARRAAVRNNIP